ncbi:VOC family protein [bacterium]|jgi:catechol 2,3-dioxygenase-like lactoylglutathione lyase family enzyme|nr:VOC family protein [bacterium]
MSLSYVDHIAIESSDIPKSIAWYSNKFDCEIKHQDSTWALLSFQNISVALVTPGDHPPHFAVYDKKLGASKNLQVHRDGIGYKYDTDPDKNVVELIDRKT